MLPTLALTVLLPAAPVPKEFTERGRIELKFGKVVDPKGDSQFRLIDDRLFVSLPANETRDLCSKTDTAPKLVREVHGDFELQVRLTAELADGAGAIHPSGFAFLGGGVQLSGKAGDPWVRFGYAHREKKGERGRMVDTVEAVPEKARAFGVENGHELDAAVVGEYLEYRLTRKGKTVTTDIRGRFSQGGWCRGYTAWECVPDGPLTVALFAHHSADKGGTVEFSRLSIKPLAEEKK